MIAKNDNNESSLEKRVRFLEDELVKTRQDHIKALELIVSNTDSLTDVYKLIKLIQKRIS